jgi:hypothetical protein
MRWSVVVVCLLLLAPHASRGAEKKESLSDEAVWAERAEEVREAILHAWKGYRQYASTSDDLKPLSKTGHDWMYARATYFDALDTLYIAGLDSEFEEAVHDIMPRFALLSPFTYLTQGVPTSLVYPVKLFEYNIRVVGGLLGAYSVSGRRELLHAAARAADLVLVGGFGTANDLPRKFARLAHPQRAPLQWMLAKLLDQTRATYDPEVWANSLSGLGTFGLELRVLSRETGDPKYLQALEGLQAEVYRLWLAQGKRPLLPEVFATPPPAWAQWVSSKARRATSRPATRGAGAEALDSGGDSFYEYLVKEQLLTPGEHSEHLAGMYDVFADSLHSDQSRVIDYGPDSKATAMISFPAGSRGTRQLQTHLSCFTGGMLALGARYLQSRAASADASLALRVTEQCVQSYMMTPTGLGADRANVLRGKLSQSHGAGDSRYHMRPEVVESLFVLYRTTGDRKHREAGWQIFQAIVRECRVESGGFTGLKSVWGRSMDPGNRDDYQPSFFLGETLKYLFLLFSPDDVIPLDAFVFNTEAHPFTLRARCKGPLVAGLVPCTGPERDSMLQRMPMDVVVLVLAVWGVYYLADKKAWVRLCGCYCCCTRARAKPERHTV